MTGAVSRSAGEQAAFDKLMGLAVFGERIAARLYAAMARVEPRYAPVTKKFSQMEAHHAVDFLSLCDALDITPDRAFADQEFGYLLEQADRHAANDDFDALVILQGFIVESLAIATYGAFISIADSFPGAKPVFERVLDEERYHVDWMTRYLRLAFFEREADFEALARRVNSEGVKCLGGTMMNIARYLDTIGLSGADCAGAMMEGYAGLLEDVGFPKKKAMKHVVSLFMPLIAKYRAGERVEALA
ncbi:MAG: long-chain fatty aldehyde decarbonylase [Methylocystis sp.]|nr:long-chain fatty aldehyde decarbonylase [Methylocystis sp.]